MKKLIVLISFLLIVVGSTTQAATEEKSFFGTWIAPWNDGSATLEIKNESLVPGTVIVIYSWDNKGNGLCAQVQIYGSTLLLNLGDETIVILRVSGNTLIGEKCSKCSTMRLQRVKK